MRSIPLCNHYTFRLKSMAYWAWSMYSNGKPISFSKNRAICRGISFKKITVIKLQCLFTTRQNQIPIVIAARRLNSTQAQRSFGQFGNNYYERIVFCGIQEVTIITIGIFPKPSNCLPRVLMMTFNKGRILYGLKLHIIWVVICRGWLADYIKWIVCFSHTQTISRASPTSMHWTFERGNWNALFLWKDFSQCQTVPFLCQFNFCCVFLLLTILIRSPSTQFLLNKDWSTLCPIPLIKDFLWLFRMKAF